MAKKITINGFGRIGRAVFKIIFEKFPDLEIVAINDLSDAKTLAHILKFDSIYGIWNKSVIGKEKEIIINEKSIKVFSEKDPANLPWKDLGVDIVIESTGLFLNYDGAKKHLDAGAKRVILSAPSKDPDKISSFLLGINAKKFDAQKNYIIDMGSCTTNCLAPLVKVLQENFGIERGFMSTIHAYTNDQKILDLPHKDLR